MEFTVFVKLSEQEVARLLELLILVIGSIIVLVLLARPLVLRYARQGTLSPVATRTVDEEEPPGGGLVKVAVWVPEANAGHVQILARELRDRAAAPTAATGGRGEGARPEGSRGESGRERKG